MGIRSRDGTKLYSDSMTNTAKNLEAASMAERQSGGMTKKI